MFMSLGPAARGNIPAGTCLGYISLDQNEKFEYFKTLVVKKESR